MVSFVIRQIRILVMTCRWMSVTAVCVLACTRSAPEQQQHQPQQQQQQLAPATALGSVMLSLPISAYHVSIAAVDDDSFYVLTAAAAYRLEPDRPAAANPLELGTGAAVTRSSIVFWSQGAVWKAPQAGGAPRRLLALPERPQRFVASPSGEDFAWLARGSDGSPGLHSVAGKSARVAYASRGSIDAVAMLGDSIVFVEGLAGAQWRIGRVGVGGGPASFTALRKGRSPSMLAGDRDITYYDGAGYQVRRLSPDLQHEETLARDFICSPLAVAGRAVYCAGVEGLFALRAGAPPRRLVAGSTERLITDVAASASRVVWAVDAGPDQMEVRSLAVTQVGPQ
jgi:hypothetical protein